MYNCCKIVSYPDGLHVQFVKVLFCNILYNNSSIKYVYTEHKKKFIKKIKILVEI